MPRACANRLSDRHEHPRGDDGRPAPSVEGTMPKYKICGLCKGKTWCSTCGGRRKVGKWVTKKCPVCRGEGNCQRCKGSGKVQYV